MPGQLLAHICLQYGQPGALASQQPHCILLGTLDQRQHPKALSSAVPGKQEPSGRKWGRGVWELVVVCLGHVVSI